MRPTTVFATVVSAAALTYAGYRYFHSPVDSGSSAGSPQIQTADETVAKPRLAAPSRPSFVRAENAAHAATRPKPLILPRKQRPTSDPSLPDASALKAAEPADVAARQSNYMPPPPVATDKVLANPKDQRWIGELSGSGARVRMRQSRQDLGCPTTGCERPANPKDIKIVGMRVKTKRLAETPSAPLDGRLKQGHYAEGTPGLYLE